MSPNVKFRFSLQRNNFKPVAAQYLSKLPRGKSSLKRYTVAQDHPGLTYDPELLAEESRVMPGHVYDPLVAEEIAQAICWCPCKSQKRSPFKLEPFQPRIDGKDPASLPLSESSGVYLCSFVVSTRIATGC